MKVGKYTYGENNIKHLPLKSGQITIGSFCSISVNIKIYTGKGTHRKEFISTYPFGAINQHIFNKQTISDLLLNDPGDVIIGDDVWIGQNVTIMPGVTIGSGSIIANNSHVIKSCHPYSIIGGNPAKLIKLRFTDDQIKKLLEIKWWDWDDAKINNNTHLITSDNIDDFINLHIVI
jgi:virginiamycin A acetyltransferase